MASSGPPGVPSTNFKGRRKAFLIFFPSNKTFRNVTVINKQKSKLIFGRREKGRVTGLACTLLSTSLIRNLLIHPKPPLLHHISHLKSSSDNIALLAQEKIYLVFGQQARFNLFFLSSDERIRFGIMLHESCPWFMCPSPGNIYVHVSFMPAGACWCLLASDTSLPCIRVPDHIFFSYFYGGSKRKIYK